MALAECKESDRSVVKQGRRRTESTVQRFAKTAIGEGFDLWDRDYLLGAMRLFLFKGETAPPFQVGPCMDATGEILVQMEEYEDAGEQFTAAAAKYALIQQPGLAKLMEIKALECSKGPRAALDEVTAFLLQQTTAPDFSGMTPTLSRIHAYKAELMLKTAADSGTMEKAVDLAKTACQVGWDRAHTAYLILGDGLQTLGRLEEACEAYANAVKFNSNCIAALERQMGVLKLFINDTSDESRLKTLRKELLQLLDCAIALHPRPTLLREKAFLLSETEGDVAALQFLDPLIKNPPPEEADAAGGVAGQTVATLLKAKAAILADGGKMSEALLVAEAALRESPGDEEAAAIVAELQQAM
ncbi:hypothetical protein C3747_51g253 [Trypanosoma cruzi]|uniref:Tetratricopeptide repeat n=2 Tax=Trypanosoma cruzi TaxID=5693 RepID=Q4CWE8_TRYCC|nr:hypothetical protein, conserved [Trypanosoma cruzi]EAN84600.1 hypothetical protein, conserved [Trypanosoma cruzi]PWV12386.1 hypothetical protein C3747_51g253 [Trypanosoma cruzi]RNC43597.1 hypothetical protein TcCL_NonESM06694 [Trypanosoma cruzi]|eukprot:XP_806451.1 hypothetical protein [Trypanosoma cruzi strain CL Brener]